MFVLRPSRGGWEKVVDTGWEIRIALHIQLEEGGGGRKKRRKLRIDRASPLLTAVLSVLLFFPSVSPVSHTRLVPRVLAPLNRPKKRMKWTRSLSSLFAHQSWLFNH